MKKVRQFFRKHAVQATISIVLALAIFGTAACTLVYLYGIDLYRDKYYPLEASQETLTANLDALRQPARLGEEIFTVEDDGRGIYCIQVTDDLDNEQQEDGRTVIESVAEASLFSQYFDLPEQDMEIVVHIARYMPIVSAWKWNMGLSTWGNYFALLHPDKNPSSRPNYRNVFRVTLRKGEYYYDFEGFCKSDSFEDFLQEAVRLANENFGAAAAA